MRMSRHGQALRNFGVTMVQLQSFFNAVFRYTCLFHNKFLLKYSISPFVSYEIKTVRLILSGSFKFFSESCQAQHHSEHLASPNLCWDSFYTKFTWFVYLFGRGLQEFLFCSIENVQL